MPVEYKDGVSEEVEWQEKYFPDTGVRSNTTLNKATHEEFRNLYSSQVPSQVLASLRRGITKAANIWNRELTRQAVYV